MHAKVARIGRINDSLHGCCISSKWPLVIFLVLILGGVLFAATAAYAQPAPTPTPSQQMQTGLQDAAAEFDLLLGVIESASKTWTATLRGYALKLFWLLAIIQFVWTFFPLVFRQADLADLVSELVRFVLIIGFFAALLEYSNEWTNAIISSFEKLAYKTLDGGPGLIAPGSSAAVVNANSLHPGKIFEIAVVVANKISTATVNATDANQGGMLGQMMPLAGLTIMMCFVFIAAFMAMTLIESWIVINMSVLFMGFGSTEWTRHYARQMLTYAFSVGVKLFVMTVIVGLILTVVATWGDKFDGKNIGTATTWTLVGLSMIAAFFSKAIPELAQSLISGTASGGNAAMAMQHAGMQVASGGRMGEMGTMTGRNGLPSSVAPDSPQPKLTSSVDQVSLANGARADNPTEGAVARAAASHLGATGGVTPPAAAEKNNEQPVQSKDGKEGEGKALSANNSLSKQSLNVEGMMTDPPQDSPSVAAAEGGQAQGAVTPQNTGGAQQSTTDGVTTPSVSAGGAIRESAQSSSSLFPNQPPAQTVVPNTRRPAATDPRANRGDGP